MPKYTNRRPAGSYGHAVGVLALEATAPVPPGDSGNTSSFNYPAVYQKIPGLDTPKCLSGDLGWTSKVVEAAILLEKRGVRGITSNCGYMIFFQKAVQEAVSIPVCLSPLVLLPFVGATLGESRSIGVMCADSSKLTVELMERAGLKVPNPIIFQGMLHTSEYRTAMLEEKKDTVDTDIIAEEVRSTVRELVCKHPEMGAIVFESSCQGAFASSAQEAVTLPCYNFVTMVDLMIAAETPHSYHGFC